MQIGAPPSIERLKKLLIYEPDTGLFRHSRTWKSAVKGEIAGCKIHQYWTVSIDNKSYLAHRVAWLYHYGKWPPSLDHKNRNKLDNRIKNLRPATQTQNQQNSSDYKRKHKLPKGVYPHPHTAGRYFSRIIVNGLRMHLGCFDDLEGASNAYKKAARKYFGEFAP